MVSKQSDVENLADSWKKGLSGWRGRRENSLEMRACLVCVRTAGNRGGDRRVARDDARMLAQSDQREHWVSLWFWWKPLEGIVLLRETGTAYPSTESLWKQTRKGSAVWDHCDYTGSRDWCLPTWSSRGSGKRKDTGLRAVWVLRILRREKQLMFNKKK